MREEIRLAASLDVARNGLAELCRHGELLSASKAAYDEGVCGMTRVGPPHAGLLGVSKLVKVEFGDVVSRADSASLPLRWEASGPGSALFPALDADITLNPDGDHATMLALTGVYRPPLGSLGAMLDRALLSHVATATIRDFVGRLANALTGPSADALQQAKDAESL